MIPLDYVHIAILALGGEIHGKTQLQKKIYFLGVLSETLDDLGYRPHFYGPHSDAVAVAVERLKTIGYVRQNVISSSGTSGFERRLYDYELTDAGRRVAELKAKRQSKQWARLQDAANRLRSAGDPDYLRLSIAAKTFFVLGEQRRSASSDELAQLPSRFGWRVTDSEIEKAADYLRKLDLLVSART